MQLEKYVRSVLIKKMEERDNLIPSTDEHHINMADNTNASRVIHGEHDRTSNIDMAPSTHYDFDTYSSRCKESVLCSAEEGLASWEMKSLILKQKIQKFEFFRYSHV